MSKISINLVTWNGEKYINHCINSILNQTFKDYELNILDNGSTDKTVEIINKNFPQFKVVQNRENIGFAKAYNKLIAWSKTDYVMCINQDIILGKDFLDNVFYFLDNSDENIGSVEPKIFQWKFDNDNPYNADKLGKTNIIDTCGIKVFKNHRAIDIGQGKEDCEEFRQDKEVFGSSGACPIYLRQALEDVKVNGEYFDEDFFSYKEDVDISYRLRLAGYKTYFVSRATCYHDRSARGFSNVLENRKRKPNWINIYSYRNHIYTILKNEFNLNLLKTFFQTFIYEFKKIVYILLYERSTMKFFIKNISNIKKMRVKREFIIRNIRRINSKELYKWYE